MAPALANAAFRQPDLPTEVQLMIIEHLEDYYKKSLASCALVARSWLSVSRAYLFPTG